MTCQQKNGLTFRLNNTKNPVFFFLFEAQLGKLYQQIGETINETPESWEKVCLYGKMGEANCYAYFFITRKTTHLPFIS